MDGGRVWLQTDAVYVTNTGEKHHRDGCRYPIEEPHPIEEADADERGYEPCKVCRP